MFVASTLIAARSLYEHVTAVADALEAGGVEAGREAVAKIVGRDTGDLDEAGVARAAIESLAENFSDGVVAPCVWGLLLGLPGMAAYKATNTADSMIGHRTERHAAFGWAAAKLDDLLNLPASRLAALWLALAAAVRGDASVKAAFATIRRDARKHRSPNAGWPEAAMAGALGLKLSGPRVYHGTETDDAWIGDGASEVTAADIRRALALYTVGLRAAGRGVRAVRASHRAALSRRSTSTWASRWAASASSVRSTSASWLSADGVPPSRATQARRCASSANKPWT